MCHVWRLAGGETRGSPPHLCDKKCQPPPQQPVTPRVVGRALRHYNTCRVTPLCPHAPRRRVGRGRGLGGAPKNTRGDPLHYVWNSFGRFVPRQRAMPDTRRPAPTDAAHAHLPPPPPRFGPRGSAAAGPQRFARGAATTSRSSGLSPSFPGATEASDVSGGSHHRVPPCVCPTERPTERPTGTRAAPRRGHYAERGLLECR